MVAEAEHINQALAAMPYKFRVSLILQHIEGFSQREIAEILNIDEKSVPTYTSIGRRRFREAYQRIENKRKDDPGSIRRRRSIQ